MDLKIHNFVGEFNEGNDMSVEIQHLTKRFGSQLAVNDVSFTANSGEVLGFLGPNGAGKSTTMKMITGYLLPTSGSVTVCGQDVVQHPIEVKQNIGYLPEHNPLYLDMYVKEYLAFAAEIQGVRKGKKSLVADLISRCGLEVEQSKKIGALSKGYRQRVGLAQAMIHDPKVLILDEPTTGLDPNQIVEIRNLIKEISQDKTVIFSTHIMQEVQAICDKVLIINRGNVVAYNNVEELSSSNQGNVVINLSFEEGIDTTLLEAIEWVERVEKVSDAGYKLRTNTQEDRRSELFGIVAEQKWKLIELSVESTSLEEVFQKLTK